MENKQKDTVRMYFACFSQQGSVIQFCAMTTFFVIRRSKDRCLIKFLIAHALSIILYVGRFLQTGSVN